MKKILQGDVGRTTVLAAFGLALAILSAAYLGYQLSVMGYEAGAGMAAVLAGLIISLCTAILILHMRRVDAVQQQLSLLMGDYLSPESTARLRDYVAELEVALVTAEEKLRSKDDPARKKSRRLRL